MKIYLVGGAVRDKLLGLPIKEKDWVVVNATVDDMLALGYRQVGKEFPVFLHPKTGEEYALARMERKVKPGYQGFTFDTSTTVSLEEDLQRRDLTINAMAETEEGQLIDPYHGQDDLNAKLLRHVSPAFAEDPVRILRIGRFFARLTALGFTIAPETIALMKNMVAAGEVNALVPERVWKELERALGEKNPEKFFEALAMCHALPILFPEIQMNDAGIKALIAAAKTLLNAKLIMEGKPSFERSSSEPITSFIAKIVATNQSKPSLICFAALLHAQDPKQITALSTRYRIPNHFKDLAHLTALHHAKALASKNLSAEALLKLFNNLDVYRREPRFLDFLIVCQAIAEINQMVFDSEWLYEGVQAVKSVNVRALIAEGLNGPALAKAITEKRLEKIKVWLAEKSSRRLSGESKDC